MQTSHSPHRCADVSFTSASCGTLWSAGCSQSRTHLLPAVCVSILCWASLSVCHYTLLDKKIIALTFSEPFPSTARDSSRVRTSVATQSLKTRHRAVPSSLQRATPRPVSLAWAMQLKLAHLMRDIWPDLNWSFDLQPAAVHSACGASQDDETQLSLKREMQPDCRHRPAACCSQANLLECDHLSTCPPSGSLGIRPSSLMLLHSVKLSAPISNESVGSPFAFGFLHSPSHLSLCFMSVPAQANNPFS